MIIGSWIWNFFAFFFVALGQRWYSPFKRYCYLDKGCDLTESSGHADDKGIHFLLFTRRNPTAPEHLHMCNNSLPQNSNYNPKKKLFVFLPGFIVGICQLSLIQDIKNAWLQKDDYNVIIVEASDYYGWNYYRATKRSLIVANRTAELLKNLQELVGLEKDNIHLVGISLGCQTAGQIGNLFKVHRITGLDPAGVLYPEKLSKDVRLDESDADLVDIIHCNTGTGLLDFGISYPAGHADFYPNGGHKQPYCFSSTKHALRRRDLSIPFSLLMPSLCSHVQCFYYYYLSIISEHGNFTAWPCDSYQKYKRGECNNGNGTESVIMGFDFEKTFTEEQSKKPLPRKYYLDTLKKWPYAKKGGAPN